MMSAPDKVFIIVAVCVIISIAIWSCSSSNINLPPDTQTDSENDLSSSEIEQLASAAEYIAALYGILPQFYDKIQIQDYFIYSPYSNSTISPNKPERSTSMHAHNHSMINTEDETILQHKPIAIPIIIKDCIEQIHIHNPVCEKSIKWSITWSDGVPLVNYSLRFCNYHVNNKDILKDIQNIMVKYKFRHTTGKAVQLQDNQMDLITQYELDLLYGFIAQAAFIKTEQPVDAATQTIYTLEVQLIYKQAVAQLHFQDVFNVFPGWTMGYVESAFLDYIKTLPLHFAQLSFSNEREWVFHIGILGIDSENCGEYNVELESLIQQLDNELVLGTCQSAMFEKQTYTQYTYPEKSTVTENTIAENTITENIVTGIITKKTIHMAVDRSKIMHFSYIVNAIIVER